jgi:hypothetical protein
MTEAARILRRRQDAIGNDRHRRDQIENSL